VVAGILTIKQRRRVFLFGNVRRRFFFFGQRKRGKCAKMKEISKKGKKIKPTTEKWLTNKKIRYIII